MNIITKTIRAGTLALLITLLPASLQAAEFFLGNNNNSIVLNGPVWDGDFNKYVKLFSENPDRKALILNSPGGKALEGFKIGAFVKSNKIRTYVPNKASCISVCAFIWVAGDIRFFGEGGKILFHGIFSTPSEDPTDNPRVEPDDIALTSYYMGDMNASLRLTLDIIKKTSPTTFIELTKKLVEDYQMPNVVFITIEPPPNTTTCERDTLC